MNSLALTLLLLMPPQIVGQPPVRDTLDQVHDLRCADYLAACEQVEAWVAALPPIGPCPDCAGSAPCPAFGAKLASWERGWEALSGVGEQEDFQREMSLRLVDGLGLRRSCRNHLAPPLDDHLKRLRKAEDLDLVSGLLRLEVLDWLEGAAGEDTALAWLGAARARRAQMVGLLGNIEQWHLDGLADARPERGPIDAVVRDLRMLQIRGLQTLEREALLRGYDARLHESLAVRWLLRHPTARARAAIVGAAQDAAEESWSIQPMYFAACLQVGTQASVEQCMEAFERIEALRKQLTREEQSIKAAARRRAPSDWELDDRDWEALRAAAVGDRGRALVRSRERIARYQDRAEALLTAFASARQEAHPAVGSERPFGAWSAWWRKAKGALPKDP